MKETDLYHPIKRFFEESGYEVKAEITDCDVVAIKEGDAPIIIELKKVLSIDFLVQSIDGNGKVFKKRLVGFVRLCKRLGLGLLSVRMDENLVVVHCEPQEYHPRKITKRTTGLLNEFNNRVGDPNVGGQSRRKIITAYRQDVLRILKYVELNGATSPKVIINELKINNAPSILQLNYYGWFERTQRGIYNISSLGEVAINDYADYFEKL